MHNVTPDTVWTDIEAIRDRAPLVHNITNFVVMNVTANALLALGASPVMAHAAEEVEDMTRIAGALVINIGTLSQSWNESMIRALVRAGASGIPAVLDPVGAGATAFRTATVRSLLDTGAVRLIRGNASEIMALVDAGVATKGVDSTAASVDAVGAARHLCEIHRCAVSVSGAVDVIVGEGYFVEIHNGHPMMPRITGLGCVATALCGAFLAVNQNPAAAAAHAMAVMGVSGEMAAEKSDGPGSLMVHFMDTLYNLNRDEIASRLQVR
ncbi:MAG TPA: hydroxyethylthiazole kinase [bacterium]|nr:hydroxyethylthiazole kinase [bacterium]